MAQLSLSSATNLFKIKYGKLSDNVYNSENVLLGRCKKDYNFTGKRMDIAVPQSFAGGVGSGSLPVSNVADYADAIISAKKMYATVEIEREAIKASMNDEGAFVRGTKEVVKKGVESWMRNMSRTLFHDGTGSLGTINAGGVTDNGGGNYSLVISAATWKESHWEENDYVNIESGNTDLFEVTTVTPSTRTIIVQRITGSQVPAAADVIFMQGSENNDPQGLKGVLDATSGTLYSVTVGRRWMAGSQIAAAAGLTTDLMNQAMLEVQQKSGKVPNLIITSFTQYRKLLNLLEDQKQYVVEPRSADLKGKVSFKGVEFMSAQGAVGVFPERFCDDDRMYFLNDSYIQIYHRPDFGWFEDDGTVFLRKASDDAYEARYGGYLQTYIVPPFHGVITGLST